MLQVKPSRILLLACAFLLCLPATAAANVGLPMIVPMGMLMLGALVPIIGIEAWILWLKLDTSFGTALAASTMANLITTVIGVPLNWIAGGVAGRLVSGFFEWSDGAIARLARRVLRNLLWVLPNGFENLDWQIYSAQIFLLVPLFFISWWLETLTVDWWIATTSADSVFSANLASYALLVLIPLYMLFSGSGRQGLRKALADAQTYRPPAISDPDDADPLDFFYPAAELELKSQDGRLAIAYDASGHTVWDMIYEKRVCKIDAEEDFSFGTFSNTLGYVAVGSRVWSCKSGDVVISEEAFGLSHAFSMDDTFFAATDTKATHDDSCEVLVWSLPTAQLVCRLEGFDQYAEVSFPEAGHLKIEDSRRGVTRYRTLDWTEVPQ